MENPAGRGAVSLFVQNAAPFFCWRLDGRVMLSSERLLRIMVEAIFVLLGVLVVWLGLTGRIFFDRRSLGWLAVSAIVLVWGVRGLYEPSRVLSRGENWSRGISLAVLGAVMLAIARVPFGWVGLLLALAGVVLAVRGIVGVALVARAR